MYRLKSETLVWDSFEYFRKNEWNWYAFVITGHQIMYSTNKREFAAGMRDQLEPLFYEYGVDLGLYGHSHIYERSCPVFQEKCLNETKAQNDYVDPGLCAQSAYSNSKEFSLFYSLLITIISFCTFKGWQRQMIDFWAHFQEQQSIWLSEPAVEAQTRLTSLSHLTVLFESKSMDTHASAQQRHAFSLIWWTVWAIEDVPFVN